jgi:hypothetical protein
MNRYLLNKLKENLNKDEENDELKTLKLFNSTKNTITLHKGRFGNQIIRNLCISIIAQKFDLNVTYSSHDKIKALGIDLFSGCKIFDNRIKLTEQNFFEILEKDSLESNLDPNDCFFQTKEITNFLYNYLQEKNYLKNKQNSDIKNNDCFIHIRLGDVTHHNPGINYYLKALSMITFNKLYITSDDINHQIIKDIIEKYKDNGIKEGGVDGSGVEIIILDEVKTIQFGSSCKNIILSHGSFSAVIGYLAIDSNIYYPKYNQAHLWYGDMFSIKSWNQVEY